MQNKIHFIVYIISMWQFIAALFTEMLILKSIKTMFTTKTMIFAKCIVNLIIMIICFRDHTAAVSAECQSIMFVSVMSFNTLRGTIDSTVIAYEAYRMRKTKRSFTNRTLAFGGRFKGSLRTA